MADAFMYLLFGKDSEGKADFELKTLDDNNVPIHRLTHEVEGVLSIREEEMVLRKQYTENWTRRRGADKEELTGHETKCFVNDVAVSVTEYANYITEICDEQRFRLITNPLAFPSLHWQTQRELLFKMAGQIDPLIICSGNNALLDLLERMKDYKTTNDYKKLVAARRAKCREELDSVRPRIEENKKMTPEEKDWVALEKTIAEKTEEIAKTETLINSEVGRVEEAQKTTQSYRNQVRELQNELADIEQEQRKAKMKGYLAEAEQHSKNVSELNRIKGSIKEMQDKKDALLKRIEEIEGLLPVCRAEWTAINAEKLVFDESKFICPTCSQYLPSENIADKKEEMNETFNVSKVERLRANEAKGTLLSKEKSEAQKTIEELTSEITKTTVAQTTLEAIVKAEPIQPEFVLAETVAVSKIRKEIEDLQKLIDSPITMPDTAELTETKNRLVAEKDAAVKEMSIREEVKRHKNRLQELLDQERTLSNELAKEEQEEMLVKEYSSLLIKTVEEKVASLFKIVKFKMFDEKLNGNIEETCVAMVNGKPYYGALNSAMRIAAGIDIINAISKHIDTTAPIWLDNRESVVNIPETQSQIINLYVAKGEPLKIK
jgi:hypothetical protein